MTFNKCKNIQRAHLSEISEYTTAITHTSSFMSESCPELSERTNTPSVCLLLFIRLPAVFLMGIKLRPNSLSAFTKLSDVRQMLPAEEHKHKHIHV